MTPCVRSEIVIAAAIGTSNNAYGIGGCLFRWIANASTASATTTTAIAAASGYLPLRKSCTAKGIRNTTPTVESAAISRSRGAGSGSSATLRLSSRPRSGGFGPRGKGGVTAAIVAPRRPPRHLAAHDTEPISPRP